MIVKDSVIKIIQGNLDPYCKIYLKENGDAVSLIGKTVTLIIKNSSSTISEREITSTDPYAGEITLIFEGEETGTVGEFNIYIRTLDAEDRPRTFPTAKNLLLKVVGI